MTLVRRSLLKGAAAACALSGVPGFALAQTSSPAARRFEPQAGQWRTFEVTTRVDLADSKGAASRVWLPVPSINSDWQRSLESNFSSNGTSRMTSDGTEGARMLYTEFAAGVTPFVEVTSRVQTQSRFVDIHKSTDHAFAREDADTLRHYTRPTHLLPTDGIVRTTALKATQGAKTDAQKARAIYDWVVANAWREPKTRGCGEGDIKTMLETGNLGGKCADINALFVGLCRSVGVPARDLYGLRLVPSAFGYRELGGNPAMASTLGSLLILVNTAALLAQRLTAKMHRELIAWGWHGEAGLCGPYFEPVMDKTAYKTQLTYPVANTAKDGGRCCQPFGRSTIVWGAGKEYPVRGEDFAFMLFRKRNCCVGY